MLVSLLSVQNIENIGYDTKIRLKKRELLESISRNWTEVSLGSWDFCQTSSHKPPIKTRVFWFV